MAKKSVVLDRDPVYRNLQKELTKRIDLGQWSKGALIPSRRALADEFQVSVPTVQKAVADMVAEGILRVNAKRGTYVFGDPDTTPEELSEFKQAVSNEQIDDVMLQPATRGYVALVADIRPGSDSDFASGWPYVIVHEAESSLLQYGFSSRFFNQFAAHRRLGGTTISPSGDETMASGSALLEDVLELKPAAVIVYEAVAAGRLQKFIHEASQAGIFTVVVGARSFGPECVSVTYDHKNGGYQAAKHLIEQGCRKILFFSPYETQHGWVDERAAGVRLAVRGAGLLSEGLTEIIGQEDLDDILSRASDPHPHIPAATNYAKQVMPGLLDIDGVVAVNDEAAFGFIRVAEEYGRRMGVDYSIIGFDDMPESHSLGLSTIHPPFANMGREAARAVAKFLRGQDDLASVTLRSRLVARMSSRHSRF